MAGEATQPLLSAGPFLGVETTEGGIYVSPTKAKSITAGNTEIIPKYLIASPGRQLLLTAPSGLNGGAIGAIAEVDQPSNGTGYGTGPNVTVTSTSTILGSVPISNYTVTVPARFIWNPTTGSSIIPCSSAGPGDLPFTQAIASQSLLGTSSDYTAIVSDVYMDNYGCQTDANLVNAVATYSNWTHYYAPFADGGSPGQAQFAGVTTGSQPLAADTYTYYITFVVAATSAVFGTIYQETTPSYLGSYTLASPGYINITPIAGLAWSGTFPNDPTVKYQTNIYRSSTAQPTLFFDGVAAGTGVYPDLFSNTDIASNQQITLQRDVPPVRPYPDFSRTGGIDTYITYNPGAPMEVHQERMWYFAYVQNADTAFGPQLQLWYSNLNRQWEFDKVNNVFLVDIVASIPRLAEGPYFIPPPTTYPLTGSSNIYVYPNNVFLETPSACKSLASVLLFWTTQKMYILYGNSPATYLFQKFADIGCLSSNSVAYATTENSIGAFWMSENGIYFTNGQNIEYVSEPIRSVIDALTIRDRFNCVGFYSNHTYYISFPDLNQTWGYRTSTGNWVGPIPYVTNSAISIPSNANLGPATLAPGAAGLYQVAAVRPNSLFVDNWFAQTDTDLGLAQTVTYQTRDQAGGNPHMEKEFIYVALVHKNQATSINCTVTVKVDDDPTKVCTATFDLSKGPVQIGTLSYQGIGSGPLRGYLASMTISFTTAAGNSTAPIEIQNVTVYGKYPSLNLTPTLGR